MKTNASSVTIENIITVTSQNGTVIHLNDQVIKEINEFLSIEPIPAIIDCLKDNIIELSTFKNYLEKNESDLCTLFTIDHDFFLFQKQFIQFLKALSSCNKPVFVGGKGGE